MDSVNSLLKKMSVATKRPYEDKMTFYLSKWVKGSNAREIVANVDVFEPQLVFDSKGTKTYHINVAFEFSPGTSFSEIGKLFESIGEASWKDGVVFTKGDINEKNYCIAFSTSNCSWRNCISW